MRGLNFLSRRLIVCLISTLLTAAVVYGQTTEFVFDGDLNDPGLNGTFDMQFRLYDASSGDMQVGSTISIPSITVVNGRFKVELDFSAVPFSGADRWVEIRTSPPGMGSYTVVTPRTRVHSSPYAIRSLVATNAEQLGGTDSTQFVHTSDPRMTNDRQPTAGSANYIQNRTSTQSGANFSIGGSGTVGGTLSGSTVNAVSQFNLGGSRILFAQSDNLFMGWSSGLSNTTGFANTALGYLAGRSNTTGGNNTTVGRLAGYSNVAGHENSMFGSAAGYSTTGSFNSFFGGGAGRFNTSGERNSFVGRDAGYRNTTGNRNAFYGSTSGNENTTGSDNAFFGASAGYANTTGSNNSALGANAAVGSGLTFATAIGSNAFATSSNSVVLGRSVDTVRVPGRLQLSTLGSAGSTTLCRNASFEIASCSSSVRYKSNITPYLSGLDIVNLLRPVSFNWKDGGALDFGFVAEDVNKVEPLLSNFDPTGRVEGIKYDRVSVVLVNAIKEQQAQIDEQKKQIAEQRAMIQELKGLVCAGRSKAAACR